MYYKKILAAALTVSCIGGIVPANSVQAASLKIRYSGKTRYYKGKQLHVSYANKNLSSKYVGIQINKVNMIPYYDYLVKQGPKVKRTYSKSSGKLILKNGDDTLTAYVGKRTYYLNGVKKTFSVAPTKVKYYKTKKTIILIPAKDLYHTACHSFRFNNTGPNTTKWFCAVYKLQQEFISLCNCREETTSNLRRQEHQYINLHKLCRSIKGYNK